MVAERGMRCMEARLPPARVGAIKVLILSPGLARPGAQAQVPVNQLGQAEIQGQGGWQDQLSIGHQGENAVPALTAQRGYNWDLSPGMP